MPKGFHTAGIAVLFERAPAIAAVEEALRDFQIAKRVPADADAGWMGGFPGLVVAMRPEVHGAVAVHSVDRPWPDSMGDPKSDPMLFGAWSMGFFGPFAFPRGLERAVQQSWSWKQAGEAVARHGGFVRLNASYVFGVDQNQPVIPKDYDPEAELRFLTGMAQALLRLPGALAYFDPSGEVVLPAGQLEQLLAVHREEELPPLPLWSNVRMARLGDFPGWMLMDSVGMAQLDIDDHEACFDPERFEPDEVALFLRNTTFYVRTRGQVIKDGDTIDGPGEVRWRGYLREESLLSPPRPVLRWFPEDGRSIPPRLFGVATPEKKPEPASKSGGVFGFLRRKN